MREIVGGVVRRRDHVAKLKIANFPLYSISFGEVYCCMIVQAEAISRKVLQ